MYDANTMYTVYITQYIVLWHFEAQPGGHGKPIQKLIDADRNLLLASGQQNIPWVQSLVTN